MVSPFFPESVKVLILATMDATKFSRLANFIVFASVFLSQSQMVEASFLDLDLKDACGLIVTTVREISQMLNKTFGLLALYLIAF